MICSDRTYYIQVVTRTPISDVTQKWQSANLTSGQGHVMTKISDVSCYQSTRLDETNTMKPSPMFYFLQRSINQELLAKNCLYPPMTSDDLSRGYFLKKTHLGHRGCSKSSWFQKIWTVSLRTHGSIGIFIFLHWFLMGRSRHCPDLRSQI